MKLNTGYYRGRKVSGGATVSPETSSVSERQNVIDTAMRFADEWQVRAGDDVYQNAVAVVYGMLLVASDVSQRMVN